MSLCRIMPRDHISDFESVGGRVLCGGTGNDSGELYSTLSGDVSKVPEGAVVGELTFPCCHFSRAAFASCRGRYQSQRASHAGYEAVGIISNQKGLGVHKNAFIPSKKNVARLQIKMQDTFVMLYPLDWSTFHGFIRRLDAHQKSKPSRNTTKNTENLFGTKQVYSRPHMIIVVELRAECLLFSRCSTLHGTKCANASRARMYLRGRIIFLRRVVGWRMRRTAESCVDVIIQGTPFGPLH
jgi:hypothetical protein